jgi:hypothetical protein
MTIFVSEAAMIPIISIALSMGLVVLWVAGLCQEATRWLTWLMLVAGVIAFGGSSRFDESPRAGVGGWGALSAGLFLLWIIALSTHATGWLAWATFFAGCACALLAAQAARGQGRGSVRLWRTRSSN